MYFLISLKVWFSVFSIWSVAACGRCCGVTYASLFSEGSDDDGVVNGSISPSDKLMVEFAEGSTWGGMRS